MNPHDEISRLLTKARRSLRHFGPWEMESVAALIAAVETLQAIVIAKEANEEMRDKEGT